MYFLSPYHQELAAQATAERQRASRLAAGFLAECSRLSPDDRAAVTADMRDARRRAERIEAQIAWERWFNGDPQVWRPAEPSWRN